MCTTQPTTNAATGKHADAMDHATAIMAIKRTPVNTATQNLALADRAAVEPSRPRDQRRRHEN
jgi:hypothetical protein